MTVVARFLMLVLFELIVLGILASLAITVVNLLLAGTGLVGPAAMGLSLVAFFAALVLTVGVGTVFLERRNGGVPLLRRLLEASAGLIVILAGGGLLMSVLSP